MAKRSDPTIVVSSEQELKERIKIAVRLRGESLQGACYRYCVNMWNKLNKCNKEEN